MAKFFHVCDKKQIRSKNEGSLGFRVVPSKYGGGITSTDVAKRMLGMDFKGVLNSDRWSAYNWLNNRQRQLCWSHLQRDFQAFVERGGESQILGEALLVQTHQMFTWGHDVKKGALSRVQFQEQMRPVRIEVGEWLR